MLQYSYLGGPEPSGSPSHTTMDPFGADDPLDRRCVKLKISKLLSSNKMKVLNDTVAGVHTVVSKTTLLIKRFYITEQLQAGEPPFSVDRDFVLLCFNVVQNVRAGRDKDPAMVQAKALTDDEERTMLYRLEACFARMGARHAPLVAGSASYIFADSADTLVTAFKNNVAARYEGYLWRLSKAIALVQHGPGDAAAAERHLTTARVGAYMRDGIGAAPSLWTEQLRGRLLVPERSADTSVEYHTRSRPWPYLRSMVLATQELNALRKADKRRADVDRVLRSIKLMSPFVLVTSFIPGHIHIGTAAMVQLLGSMSDVHAFKEAYLAEHDIALNIANLSDVSSSFQKATGRATTSADEEALYATRLWETVCQFDKKKAYKALVGQGTHRLSPEVLRVLHMPKAADGQELWRFNNNITTHNGRVQREFFHRPSVAASEEAPVGRTSARHRGQGEGQGRRPGAARVREPEPSNSARHGRAAGQGAVQAAGGGPRQRQHRGGQRRDVRSHILLRAASGRHADYMAPQACLRHQGGPRT